jgi:2-polyprenyl-3-methyl-5-hydroxy-6-metoxy-1,4-benzoquinol methylase
MEIRREDGTLLIEELGNGLRKVTALNAARDAYRSRGFCTTTYPVELIEMFLDRAGVAEVCEVIGRDGDSIMDSIRDLTSAYVDAEKMTGKRILDFGCGGGASTVILAKLFPDSQVIGVELMEEKLQMGRARAAHHGLRNIQFLASPDGSHLPRDLGTFHFVYLFAVYEHLLPDERPVIMKLVWQHLEPEGIVFVDATPHRYFPIDLHSTHLPLINYLPDRAAHWAARKFASGGDVNRSPVWSDHLRGGIRGATEKSILRSITSNEDSIPVLLEPSQRGLKDRCDYWHSRLSHRSHKLLKGAAKMVLKTVYGLTGTVLTPNLSIAIQKQVPVKR